MLIHTEAVCSGEEKGNTDWHQQTSTFDQADYSQHWLEDDQFFDPVFNNDLHKAVTHNRKAYNEVPLGTIIIVNGRWHDVWHDLP